MSNKATIVTVKTNPNHCKSKNTNSSLKSEKHTAEMVGNGQKKIENDLKTIVKEENQLRRKIVQVGELAPADGAPAQAGEPDRIRAR